jgi:hypothetical protein
MPSKRQKLTGAAVLVLLLAFLLPIRIPYRISAPGKVLCSHEWMVTVTAGGGIITSVLDRNSGVTRRYDVSEFSRGDAIRFSLDPRIVIGSALGKGDTVGVLESSETERELANLHGDLASARASLAALAAGEKESIVDEARQKVEFAKRRSQEMDILLARQKKLHERDLISREEYELAEQNASGAAIHVSIAEAQLRSAVTGVKSEQIRMAREQIVSLEREIKVLERRRKGYELVMPLAGLVMQAGAGDTLLVVSDTTEYVVVMPLPLNERSFVSTGRRVRLRAETAHRIPDASVTAVDQAVHSLAGRQVVLATARLQGTPREVLHGLTARCTVMGEPVSLVQYLRRKLRAPIQ